MNLPAPLRSVRVPSHFSPSAVATFEGCRLRLLATHRDFYGIRLPSGIEAAIGTLFHRVVEEYGSDHESHSPEETFDSVLVKVQDEISMDVARKQFADLKKALPYAEWLGLRAAVKRQCLRNRSARPRPFFSHTNALPSGPRPGFESKLSSDYLRLAGRADRIQTSGPRSFTIRDYKTGAIWADDHIKEEIAFQLRCYGLLLLESAPDAHVRLIVDDGEEHEVSFAPVEREATLQKLISIFEPLPANAELAASSLAKPGPACTNCPVRHVCSAYLKIAPEWWRRYPTDISRIPTDSWGEAVEFTPDDNGATIRLKDAAGRPVKITGLTVRHGISSICDGDMLYFFNLIYTGTGRDRGGRPFYPHAFHEMPRDRGERRAWNVQVFQS
jgi:RecB family exonuclease